jgi:hypothetical protein
MVKRFYSGALAVAVMAGALVAGTAQPAEARSKSKETMWRLGTYAGAGLTVAGALKKNPIMAGVGAVGTYYAYKNWKDEVKDRHEDERWGYDRDRRYRDRRSDDRYNNDRYDRDRYSNDRYRSDRYNNDRYRSDRYYNSGYSDRRNDRSGRDCR